MNKKIRELQTRIGSSKDGRTLASHFGYLMLLQISGYVFPLLTIPYLARVIGVDGFGKIAFAAAVVVWFQTVTDWGFNYTATRDVAKNRDDPRKVSEIFSNVLWARMVLMLISFALLLIAIVLIPLFERNQVILMVTFLLVPGHIMFPEWFFQAMERMKYIAIFNLLIKFVFTVMVFVFINSQEDFILQPIFMTLGYLMCGFFSMYLVVVKWKIKIHAPQWQGIVSTIKGSNDVFVSNIVPNFYNSFSVVLLGFFGGVVSNGLLDAGQKFVNISQQLMVVVSRSFFPLLSRKIEKHALYVSINSFLAIGFFVVLYSAAPTIIELFFTPEFQPAVLVLQIMALSIVFMSIYNSYGVNYLIIVGREKELRVITLVVSGLGFLIAFPLIYQYDYIGAAITSTVTRAGLSLAVMARAIKVKRETKSAAAKTECNT